MAIPNTVSGKVGRALIGTIPITVTRWEVDDDADDLDATTAESDGFGDADTGVEQLSGTIEFTYKIGVTKINQMAPGLGVAMKLYTFKYLTDIGPYYDVPLFAISNLNLGSEVRGMIKGRCRFKSKGTFSRPVDPV